MQKFKKTYSYFKLAKTRITNNSWAESKDEKNNTHSYFANPGNSLFL